MTWLEALPALLLATGLLVVPGACVGYAMGLRREAWVGTAPGLSIGVLAVAVVLSSLDRQRWGLTAVLVATVVVTLIVLSLRYGLPLLHRWVAPRAAHRAGPLAGRRLIGTGAHAAGRVRTRVTGLREEPLPDVIRSIPRFPWAPALLAVAAGLTIGTVIAWGMDSPSNPQQVYDSAFHVNAIQRVASVGSASPAVVSATPSLGAVPAGFYPPLFHAIAALLVGAVGANPVVAANVLALTIAAVAWPLSMAFLVAVMAPRRVLAWAVALIAMVSIPASPYLFLSFGVLWPNALGMATVPACLVLVARVLGRARIHDPSLTVGRAVLAGLINAAGLYYAHPSAVFSVLALALPILVAWVGLQLSRVAMRHGARPALGLASLLVVLVVLVVRLVWNVPQIASVRQYDWPAAMSTQQALGEVLSLGIGDAPPVWIVAALTVAGAVTVLGRRVTSWMAWSMALACYLYVLAAGNDDPISQDLTGFWYNDRWRVGSLAVVLVPPLAAAGVVWVVDALRAYVVNRLALDERWSRRVGVALACLAVVGTVAAMPRNDALHDPEVLIARGYFPQDDHNRLVTSDETAMYAALGQRVPAGERIIGDPYSGAVFAGVLSGRQAVFPHFSGKLSADQVLLSERFRDYRRDPQVCAAVKRLHVGFAVGDTQLYWEGSDKPGIFAGVRDLRDVDGLEPVTSAGTATVYRVLPCRS